MKHPLHCAPLVLFVSPSNPSGVTFEYAHFLEYLVDSNRRFTGSGTGIRAADRILRAVKKSAPGEHYEIEESDWKLLSDAAEQPEQGYPRLPGRGADGNIQHIETGRHLVSFVNSIVEAPAERPERSTAPLPKVDNGRAAAQEA